LSRKTYEYNYLVFESCAETRYKLSSDWDLEEADRHILEAVAQEAADDFGDNHDGHEMTWPLMFRLEKLDGTALGDFKVYREMEPRYTAYTRPKPPVVEPTKVSVELIRQVRALYPRAGIADCREALIACNRDVDAAVRYLDRLPRFASYASESPKPEAPGAATEAAETSGS
jgi:hypothetical protein